jgi:hypothetical protein
MLSTDEIQPREAIDDLEGMGSQIAKILQAAKDAAGAITAEAEAVLQAATQQADERLVAANQDAEELLAAAEAIRTEAIDEAAKLRAEAERVVADAHRELAARRQEAEQIAADARRQADDIRRTASEQVEREQADARAAVHERLEQLAGHETAIRDRLFELATAVQEAQTALSPDGEHVAAESHG